VSECVCVCAHARMRALACACVRACARARLWLRVCPCVRVCLGLCAGCVRACVAVWGGVSVVCVCSCLRARVCVRARVRARAWVRARVRACECCARARACSARPEAGPHQPASNGEYDRFRSVWLVPPPRSRSGDSGAMIVEPISSSSEKADTSSWRCGAAGGCCSGIA
jgi:hypothetical protein